MNQLQRARLVAEHDELHLLLVAHRLDPSRDAHRPVVEGGKVLDEGATGHVPRVYCPRDT
ncbi:MAG: hypothetical protein WDM88_07935 [Galbitalea sp.]